MCTSRVDQDTSSNNTVLCRYNTSKMDFDAAYDAVKGAIMDNFYGPPNKGVYSPSVQFTLYEMGKLVIQR